jgi:NAD(P)-dependent dehydrogenase (short-subunit alcohol dehydrogenase family)
MMARALDANGAARVYILGRREHTLKEAATKAINGNIIPIVCDVGLKESLKAAADQVLSEAGHVNVLIANAGASSPLTYPPGTSKANPPSIESLSEFMWSADSEKLANTSHIILTSTYFTVAAFLPLLTKANQLISQTNPPIRPQIIATSSTGSFDRNPMSSLGYGAAKAGLNHMIKSLTTLLAPYDIRANVIAPGFYLSELSADAFKKLGIKGDGVQEGSFPASLIPAKRAGGEEDMAGVTLFLCSRAGAYINGSVILSDGGSIGIRNGTY